jgi:hypothetical protein
MWTVQCGPGVPLSAWLPVVASIGPPYIFTSPVKVPDRLAVAVDALVRAARVRVDPQATKHPRHVTTPTAAAARMGTSTPMIASYT